MRCQALARTGQQCKQNTNIGEFCRTHQTLSEHGEPFVKVERSNNRKLECSADLDMFCFDDQVISKTIIPRKSIRQRIAAAFGR